MENRKKVVVLIDVYSENGGGSKVAVSYARKLCNSGYNALVACSKSYLGEKLPDDVYLLDSTDKCGVFLLQNNVDVIHYFKAAKSHVMPSIFSLFIRAKKRIDKDIKVLLTVCQQPSCPTVILTPYEIVHSDHIFFLDKTAYNDDLYSFIPEEKKSCVYMIASKQIVFEEQKKYEKLNYTTVKQNEITFGRGSTLNKCPKDLIEVYDSIETNQKKNFVIIGVPENNNWLKRKIAKRGGDDIITYPLLASIEYAERLRSFDIFLYYIPTNMYSSIDGSLIFAMRMGLPVVVYGAPAPKEMVIHGVNGFIAETKEEFVKYAEQLAADVELRETIGGNARTISFERAPDKHWPTIYMETMEQVCNSGKQPAINVPLLISLKIYFLKYSAWSSEMLLKIWSLLLKR